MIKKRNLPEYYLLNHLLKQWNPLCVEGSALDEEYIGLIPQVFAIKDNKEELMTFFKNVLIDQYGLDYNEKNEVHFNDLKNFVEEIICTLYNR